MIPDRRSRSRRQSVRGRFADMDTLLKAVLESAAQAILMADSEGRLLTINAKTEEMFGYPASELIGEPVEILIPEAVRRAHERSRHEYFASPRVRPMGLGMELAGRRKDGTEFPVEISLSYVESAGEILAIAFVSDVTIRKGLELQLLESQKMDALGRLAGGIAHDFNNLLTVISGFDRLMLEGLGLQDRLRGYAEQIQQASERASALVKQLLAFSRRQIVQPRVVNVNELIRHMNSMLRRLLPESVELVFIPRPDVGHVRVDPSQFEQVLMNLVVNARDAVAENGRITIETNQVELGGDYARTHLGVKLGSFVMIAVTDDGIGMDSETKKRIFEPFFTTKPVERGTGLGLATVYGIVKQSGGDIWVYSEPGHGTTFKVYLPLTTATIDPPPAENHSSIPEKATPTILVVEDEEGVRHLVSEILRKDGFRVLTASTAPEGIQVLSGSASQIDLLLTDIVLQGGSGLALAKEASRRQPGIKVLYMSGYTENTMPLQDVPGSQLAFIQKPFSFETLLDKVASMLAERQA